ncbi:hypothetical protein D3C74_375540 [compost metagenome]
MTDRRGKSRPVPSDHLTSIPAKPGYCLVVLTYCLRFSTVPPSVALMPCSETMTRPVRFHCSPSERCHSCTARGSASGVKA